MSCTLKKCARPAVLSLALWIACICLAPEALAQSLDIPLQLEQGNSGVILTINVGINGAAPRPYLFDTGSGVFNAYYSTASTRRQFLRSCARCRCPSRQAPPKP